MGMGMLDFRCCCWLCVGGVDWGVMWLAISVGFLLCLFNWILDIRKAGCLLYGTRRRGRSNGGKSTVCFDLYCYPSLPRILHVTSF